MGALDTISGALDQVFKNVSIQEGILNSTLSYFCTVFIYSNSLSTSSTYTQNWRNTPCSILDLVQTSPHSQAIYTVKLRREIIFVLSSLFVLVSWENNNTPLRPWFKLKWFTLIIVYIWRCLYSVWQYIIVQLTLITIIIKDIKGTPWTQYSWFHENGSFSVLSFSEHYLSIPQFTGNEEPFSGNTR